MNNLRKFLGNLVFVLWQACHMLQISDRELDQVTIEYDY